MVKEVDIQANIVEAVNKELGGYAHKLSNAYQIGIPDLLILMPHYPMLIVEVKKLAALPVHDSTPIKIDLTVLQSRSIRNIHKAGGNAGWLLVCKTRSVDYFLAGREIRDFVTKGEFIQCAQTRPRGVPLSKVLPTILAPCFRNLLPQ